MERETQKYPRILRWPEVHERVGLSHSQIYNLMKARDADNTPLFPLPIKLSKRASGWLESEINSWIEMRIAESNKGAAL